MPHRSSTRRRARSSSPSRSRCSAPRTSSTTPMAFGAVGAPTSSDNNSDSCTGSSHAGRSSPTLRCRYSMRSTDVVDPSPSRGEPTAPVFHEDARQAVSSKGAHMATLSAWKFDDAGGAARAEDTLVALQKQGLITVHDAAEVSWPMDKKRPKTKQLHNLTGAGALGGSFWGLLFGLLFFVPLLGMAMGAAIGALSGSMADVGIDDDFIAAV